MEPLSQSDSAFTIVYDINFVFWILRPYRNSARLMSEMRLFMFPSLGI